MSSARSSVQESFKLYMEESGSDPAELIQELTSLVRDRSFHLAKEAVRLQDLLSLFGNVNKPKPQTQLPASAQKSESLYKLKSEFQPGQTNIYLNDKTEVEKVFTVPVSFFIENPPEVFHVRLEVHPSFIDEHGNKVELLPVKELKLPDKYANPWGGRKRKVFVYKVKGEIISPLEIVGR